MPSSSNSFAKDYLHDLPHSNLNVWCKSPGSFFSKLCGLQAFGNSLQRMVRKDRHCSERSMPDPARPALSNPLGAASEHSPQQEAGTCHRPVKCLYKLCTPKSVATRVVGADSAKNPPPSRSCPILSML